jgi:4-hydroxy-tetrahydrodipicolinate synthase
MVDLLLSNNLPDARAIHEEIVPLCDAMFIETNPIPVKTAMNLIGMNAGTLRLPLVEMENDNKKRLISVVQKYNFTIKE